MYVCLCLCLCLCVCMQDEITELAKQVMEGKNRYEAIQMLRRKVSVGEWGGEGREGGREGRKRRVCTGRRKNPGSKERRIETSGRKERV